MRRPQMRRAALVLTLGLLVPWTVLLADPFQQRPIPLPWTDSRDVAVADFNNDGLPDIAALDSYGPVHTECYPPPGPISCGDRMLLTVALNEGRLLVGLSRDELEQLATAPAGSVRKVSRPNLGAAIASGGWGATTVSRWRCPGSSARRRRRACRW